MGAVYALDFQPYSAMVRKLGTSPRASLSVVPTSIAIKVDRHASPESSLN